MSAHVSAAISPLWLIALAQKNPSFVLLFHGWQANAACWFGMPSQRRFRGWAVLAHGGAGGCDPCISGYFLDQKTASYWHRTVVRLVVRNCCCPATHTNHIETDSLLEMYHRHRLVQGDCSRFL